MKNFLYILVILNFFLSCKSNTKQTIKDSTTTIKPTVDKTQDLIQKFKPAIEGMWVKTEYIDELGKTKSPLKSMPDGIVEMHFDTDSIKGDSLLVPVGWNNHEGGQFILKFQAGISGNSLKAYIGTDTSGGFHEIGISKLNKDTLLTLYHFDKQKKLIDKFYYKRIFNKVGDGDATHYVVNKQTIAGKYVLKDSLGKLSVVSFYNEGNVTGFQKFKTYSLAIDFNTPPSNLDEIFFDSDEYSNKGISYSFRFIRDTLNLYQTSLDKDSVDLM